MPLTPSKATNIIKGSSKLSTPAVSVTNPIFLGDNDPRIPTQDQNDAMAGTGTPGSGNKYATADHAGISNNIKTSGAQSMDGVKTFTSIPVSSAGNPLSDNEMANKAYVDSLI